MEPCCKPPGVSPPCSRVPGVSGPSTPGVRGGPRELSMPPENHIRNQTQSP